MMTENGFTMEELLTEARAALQERLVQAQDDNRRLRYRVGYMYGAIGVAVEQLKEGVGDPIATLEDALRETEGSP